MNYSNDPQDWPAHEVTYYLKTEDGHFWMIDDDGGLVFDDLDDLNDRQRDELVRLYNDFVGMDWETAWPIIKKLA